MQALERKEKTGPQPIASAIREFLSQSGLRRSREDERVCQAWEAAAGSPWNESAWPVAFRAGQLTVEVASSVTLSELKGFHGEGIRARANATLREQRIRKVVYKLQS